jgi:lipooligosaccharide transport system ATP-binding protein
VTNTAKADIPGRWTHNKEGAPSAGNAELIAARDLVKVFPPSDRKGEPFRAVDGISFTLERGEALGFLGPNGAGKSSTMRMISCVSPVTMGTLRIFGIDPAVAGHEIRARLGVVSQEDALDQELSVRENILIYGRYFGIPKKVLAKRIESLLAYARLEDKADSKVDELSGGMRRRLSLARSLVNEPEILLLDEPTTGLDPQARRILWDQLYRLKESGTSLVLTTHYMDEAEQLCDRIAVVDHGRIIAEGTPAALIEKHASRDIVELRFAPDTRDEALQSITAACPGERIEQLPDQIVVHTSSGERTLARVTGLGVAPLRALVRRSTLEDVFLNLTGRSLIE